MACSALRHGAGNRKKLLPLNPICCAVATINSDWAIVMTITSRMRKRFFGYPAELMAMLAMAIGLIYSPSANAGAWRHLLRATNVIGNANLFGNPDFIGSPDLLIGFCAPQHDGSLVPCGTEPRQSNCSNIDDFWGGKRVGQSPVIRCSLQCKPSVVQSANDYSGYHSRTLSIENYVTV